LGSKLLKFKDLVELRTLIVMFKAKDRVLPTNLQRLFILIENEGRRKGHFRYQTARTTAKQFFYFSGGSESLEFFAKRTKAM